MIILFYCNTSTAYPSGDDFSEGAGGAVLHVCVPLLSWVCRFMFLFYILNFGIRIWNGLHGDKKYLTC